MRIAHFFRTVESPIGEEGTVPRSSNLTVVAIRHSFTDPADERGDLYRQLSRRGTALAKQAGSNLQHFSKFHHRSH